MFLASNSILKGFTHSVPVSQKLTDRSTSENLETVTCSGVMTKTASSLRVRAHIKRQTLSSFHKYEEVEQTGLKVHRYLQDTDVLLLAFRSVP